MEISPAMGTILGSALGATYFWVYESSIPKTSSCTYMSPWTTDLYAWLTGAWLIHRSSVYNDGILSLIGATIMSLHVAQYAAHKVLVRRINEPSPLER